MIDLTGHVALVTGSSRGIGRACALRLAQAGADVVINYISRREAADDVAGRITAIGRRTAVIRADISEPDDIAALAGHVEETFGQLDILISNAATGGFRPLLLTTRQQFTSALNTNVEALLNLLKVFVPLLKGAATRSGGHSPRRAKVVAISSLGSRFALPQYGLVGLSKAALESLVRQAALELGNEHINFNTLISGLVETDATRDVPNRDDIFARQDARSLCGDRRLTVEDVADVVLFLSSPLADMIQGQVIVVDAGVSIAFG